MTDRDDRIETYYQESAWDLAERLVDAEDELEVWKAQVVVLQDRVEGLKDRIEALVHG